MENEQCAHCSFVSSSKKSWRMMLEWICLTLRCAKNCKCWRYSCCIIHIHTVLLPYLLPTYSLSVRQRPYGQPHLPDSSGLAARLDVMAVWIDEKRCRLWCSFLRFGKNFLLGSSFSQCFPHQSVRPASPGQGWVLSLPSGSRNSAGAHHQLLCEVPG